MPVFTSKNSTDPGPFDALRPGPDREPEPATRGTQSAEQKEQSALAAPDEVSEVERLYRFQEIPVSADMRRELLGAKLPLASADQLADTQPPNKSALSAPTASPVVDRHAPTEPALTGPARSPDRDAGKGEPPLADTDRYSTTAPTLLSVRRRRLRNQRLVALALAAMILAIFSGVAWRRYTRQQDATVRTASTARAQAPRIAGNRPAAPAPARIPEKQAGDPIETPGSTVDRAPEISGAHSENAQPNAITPDATRSSPLSPSPESAANDPMQAETETARAAATQSAIGTPQGTIPTPRGTSAPSKRKAFDPEELIF